MSSTLIEEKVAPCVFTDLFTGQRAWIVQSHSDPGVFYRAEYVQATPGRAAHWKCECKSGEFGFANVQHPSGVCTHCRDVQMFVLEARAKLQQRGRAA